MNYYFYTNIIPIICAKKKKTYHAEFFISI